MGTVTDEGNPGVGWCGVTVANPGTPPTAGQGAAKTEVPARVYEGAKG